MTVNPYLVYDSRESGPTCPDHCLTFQKEISIAVFSVDFYLHSASRTINPCTHIFILALL